MTIGAALADAWKVVGDNSKSESTTNKYTVVGKVVFEGAPYNNKVEI